jgi:hypothetical protein
MFCIEESNIEKHDMGIVLFKNVIPMEKYSFSMARFDTRIAI